MRLRIVLPSSVFLDVDDVTRVVAQGRAGSFGLLPQRRDCVAALAPGILTYETAADGELHAAVDEGILVKSGAYISVATRNAAAGAELGKLREAIETQTGLQDEAERSVRTVLSKLEGSLVRRLLELHRR